MAKVKEPGRDWEALERKLRAGKTIDQAADEVGIPLEELGPYFEERSQARKHDQEAHRRVTATALQTGMGVLRKVARAGPRYTETTYNDEGKPESTRRPESSDVDAAKALLKFASEQLRRPPAQLISSSSGQRDLFDGGQPEGLYGPWQFGK